MMTMLCILGLYVIVRKLSALWATFSGNPVAVMGWIGAAKRALGR
jgi:hypothetical protein